ncbi:hypothetical protein Tco_1483746 [Tanacetum coccineum]
MPPRVMTRSDGRPATAPRGGGMGGRVGREGKRVREPRRRNVKPTGKLKGHGNDQGVEVNRGVDGVPDFSTIIAQQLLNLLPVVLALVSNQGSNQENDRNQNGDAVNDNIQGDKMESVQDMSGCEVNKKVKYTAGLFVGKDLTWWNSHIHTRSQEVAIKRKPRVQIEENSIWTDSSTETMVDDMLVAGSDMAEFNKPKCWAKLVRILISEGSLSLLKILGTKSLAEMFTRLVMKEKLKLCAASTEPRVNNNRR